MSPDIPPAAPSDITPRQAIVIDLLATGSTITKAAEQGGIARKTLYNWLESEAFQAALEARRHELAERVKERVAELGQAAINTLLDVLAADESIGYQRKAQADLAERLLTGMGLLAGVGAKPADRP